MTIKLLPYAVVALLIGGMFLQHSCQAKALNKCNAKNGELQAAHRQYLATIEQKHKEALEKTKAAHKVFKRKIKLPKGVGPKVMNELERNLDN